MRPLLPRDFKYLGWHTPVDNFEVTSITVTVDSDTSVSVEWWLSAPGTGQLEYGLTTAYGSATAVESSYLTYHFQTITGLTPGTTYNVRAKSVSESAVTVYSEDHEVTTTGSSVSTAGPRPAPAVPTGPAVKVIGTDTAAVDDTGASDVTAALNTILANLNAGDVLVFAQGDPEGDTAGVDAPISEYRVSGALELPHVSDVVLWGYGTASMRSSRSSHRTETG